MRKILCMLLVLLIVLPLVASCGDKDDSSKPADTSGATKASSDTSATSGTVSDVSNASSGEAYVLPDVDMGGREFYIMERWFGYGKESIDFTGEVLYVAEEDGTMTGVNTKKKEIIDELQAEFNCKITGELYHEGDIPAAQMRDLITNDISSGTDKYDMFFETYYYYAALISQGYLLDLKTLKNIDFSRDCWDQNAVNELSVCNSLYFGIGDINTYDNDGTFVVLFNKDIYEKEGFTEDLYALAEAGTWTFDKLKSIAKTATKNLTGTEEIDEFDQWGFGSETANLYLHCLAAGERIVSKDSNDVPQLTMCSEKTYSVLADAVEYYKSGNALIADDGTWAEKYQDVYQGTVTKAFLDGRELFYMCGLLHVPYFREMADDFGILPVPKYTADQTRYYSSVQVHTMSCLMIPNGSNAKGEQGEQLGTLIQALAERSREKLTPEYYEKQLKGRESRDPESKKMLDIIFEDRVFDLGSAFGQSWGDAYSYYEVLDTNIASRFESAADSIQAKIDDEVELIRAMQELAA